jgi:UDP-glucose 4-epimerase
VIVGTVADRGLTAAGRPAGLERGGARVRVVVTGAGGRLGRIVVGVLLAEGMDVLGVDRDFPAPGTGPMYERLAAEMTDLGQVYGALAGADAVVHLAATPSPGGRPPEKVYGNNTMGQFHVFEAAARLGIRRVVSASSLSAYGFPFQQRPVAPRYVPLDEDHPLLPQDPYALSKVVGEQIAESYVRRDAGTAVSLRFCHVTDDEALPRRVEFVRDRPEYLARELWAYVHVRDAARACLLALTAPVEGHVAVLIAAPDTLSDLPTDDLVARHLPDTQVREHGPGERWPLLDTGRAARLLGFEAAYLRDATEKEAH